MKLVRKTLLGLAALAVVMGLASCKFGAGIGSTSGSKYNKDMTVDATPENTKKPCNTDYRRFWEELSTLEACAELTTKVTIDYANSTMASGVATTGLIFDCNKSESGNTVDFILVGISPAAGFYVEKYSNIEKGKAASLDTDDGAISTTFTSLDGKASNKNYQTWSSVGITPQQTDDGKYEFTVKIAQETPGTYKVYINNKKVSNDSAMAALTPANTKELKKNGVKATYAVGGIACYGSVSKGNKLIANFATDKDSVLGTLNAEEIEE